MSRTYLFVPVEEQAEVKASGAGWNKELRCWYVDGPVTPASPYLKWVPCKDDPLVIASNDAWVASAKTPCQHCGACITVICIYIERGMVKTDPLPQFTVSHISVMSEPLLRQLAPWPEFRQSTSGNMQGLFANHCSHCGAAQDDALLHPQPGAPFCDIPEGQEMGEVTLTRLEGTVRLGGDDRVEVHSPWLSASRAAASSPMPKLRNPVDSAAMVQDGRLARRAANLELFSIDAFYRGDHPDGICVSICRDDVEGDLQSFWQQLLTDSYQIWNDAHKDGTAEASVSQMLELLSAPVDDSEDRFVQLVDICLLERAGMIQPDEHNGVFLVYRSHDGGELVKERAFGDPQEEGAPSLKPIPRH